MYSHINDLPLSGGRPTLETQASVDELSDLLMPVVNHPEVMELGFSVTHLTMDSDPELYEVRQIWVRTIHDEARQPHELGLSVLGHPTLGKVLFGRTETDLERNAAALWNALRDSRYRNAVLSTFSTGYFTISREGITELDEIEPWEDDWQ